MFKVWDKVKVQMGIVTHYTTIDCISSSTWLDTYTVVCGNYLMAVSNEHIKICTEREIDNYYSS